MDPFTQGVVGAVASCTWQRASQIRMAASAGFLAALAPDLDVLIRSNTDSLLMLEYHRQFTHSFIFIPIGGLVVSCVLALIFRKNLQISFWQLLFFCMLGYATHGVLDFATSYGTLLLWPFSNTRFSLNIISVVDPIFTFPIFLCVILCIFFRTKKWALLGVSWIAFYLCFGAFQNFSAKNMIENLARERNHHPTRILVKPTFANALLWRTIYEENGIFYIDAVRPNFVPKIFEGEFVRKLDIKRDFPWLDLKSQQAQDINRFSNFSDGFIAKAKVYEERIIDVRYSLHPFEVKPLWSIRLKRDAEKNAHAQYETHRNNMQKHFTILMRVIFS